MRPCDRPPCSCNSRGSALRRTLTAAGRLRSDGRRASWESADVEAARLTPQRRGMRFRARWTTTWTVAENPRSELGRLPLKGRAQLQQLQLQHRLSTAPLLSRGCASRSGGLGRFWADAARLCCCCVACQQQQQQQAAAQPQLLQLMRWRRLLLATCSLLVLQKGLSHELSLGYSSSSPPRFL
jgi:hypothetical protein